MAISYPRSKSSHLRRDKNQNQGYNDKIKLELSVVLLIVIFACFCYCRTFTWSSQWLCYGRIPRVPLSRTGFLGYLGSGHQIILAQVEGRLRNKNLSAIFFRAGNFGAIRRGILVMPFL